MQRHGLITLTFSVLALMGISWAGEKKVSDAAQNANRQNVALARMLLASETRGQLEERLRIEPGLDSKKIQVSLSAKVIKLSGSVPTNDDRQKAVEIARSYAGNRLVEDHLTIQNP